MNMILFWLSFIISSLVERRIYEYDTLLVFVYNIMVKIFENMKQFKTMITVLKI